MVAIWVVDVPEVAVGAVGTPLNAGFDADNDIPLMVPPVIATKLASCVDIVPTVVMAPDAKPSVALAPAADDAPVPPSTNVNGVIPVIVPPVTDTLLAFC